MDKKKLYLIIGGVVLAIALVIALVVGLGGNKTETPNGETTTPTVNESVGDNGGETTTPEGGETTTPDGNETTTPDDEISDSDDVNVPGDEYADNEPGDVIAEGVIYNPDVEITNYQNAVDFLKNNGDTVKKEDGLEMIVIRKSSDEATIITRNESGIVFVEEETPSKVTVVGYDKNGVVINKMVTNESFVEYIYSNVNGDETVTEFESPERAKITKTNSDGSEMIYNIKIVDGKNYILSSKIRGFTFTYEYVSENSGTLKRYVSVNDATGETLDWAMDGVGNGPEHATSLTWTKNGKTTVYEGKDIPNNMAIHYPPKDCGI